ncbi:MAG: RidA family protein [Kiloniellales bacterium]|nr:RidA family protein [Kiloniellales bacterium]
MPEFLTPKEIASPFARYSHGVLVKSGSKLLFCSGQLGIAEDQSIPETAFAQAELCFWNIGQILAAAGMGPSNLVRINAYVTDRKHLGDYMRARDGFIGSLDPPPASTLMIVRGFAREAFKVEVEAIAAGE